MIKEHCYGIVPLKRIEGKWHVLLLLHAKGSFWGFPKGHKEAGESDKKAAIRELEEETSLKLKNWILSTPLEEYYEFTRDDHPVLKTVTYFIAEVEGSLVIDRLEILGAKWVSVLEAEIEVTYPESKAIMKKVANQLKVL